MANSATVEGRVAILGAPERVSKGAAPKKRVLSRRTIAAGAAAALAAVGAIGWAVWPRGAADPIAEREDYASKCAKRDAIACLAVGETAWAAPDGARDLGAAERGFQTACDAGEPRGCVRLAHLYEDATLPDAKKALAQELRRRAAAVYEKQCEAEDAYACLVLGALTITGKGVQKSTPRSQQLYAQARGPIEQQCADPSTPAAAKVRACNALSIVLARGLGGAKDTARSIEVLAQACELGDAAACMLAGSIWADGPGVREVAAAEPARAPAPLKKGCDLGDARACHALAKLLRTEKSADALALDTKACESGLASACMEVGLMTFGGAAGAADPKKAREWFVREVTLRQKACDAGVGDECADLSQNYRSRGQGVPIDPARAKELDDKASASWSSGCDAGLWSECLALRTRLEKEPMPDLKRVRALRERECALGYEHSCRRLGIAYAPPRP
jgi:TPR repeat protein